MPSGLDPMTEVSSIVSRSRSSFTWGMRSLPKARRDAIFAVYAFCRIVDDIADCESMHADRKRALLEAWRIEIEQVYAGLPKSSIGRALLVAVDHFDLPGAEFRMMLEGMKMDVDGPIVAPAKADLLDYTRRVAGSVGALSIRIFGARDCPERDRFALTLADALQLTNILRDVEEDAQIGRVYLPRQSLATHGLPVHDPAALIADLTRGHAALPAICAEVGAMARTRFQEAREALGALEPASVRPALMMMGVYEGYLDRMEALGHARHVRALTMPRWQKLARSLRYAYAPPRRAAPISSGVMGSRP
ncbi:MAG: squalene/phytoene synthase family protein [Pseudomonadota bacterium]